MLNTFPSLLVLQFYAPTIIRIGAACVLAYMVYADYKHRTAIAHDTLPVIGKQPWVAWFSIIVCGIVAVMLFAGYYTQIAALLTAVIAIKGLFWGKRLGALLVFSRSTYFLLLAAALSLLVSGAGAFAFDLPL